jgi:hypothetical protein
MAAILPARRGEGWADERARRHNVFDMLDAPDRIRGPRLRTAIPVIVIGLVLGISGAVALGVAFWDVITGPRYVIPGTVVVHLDSGTHIVFEQTGTSESSGALTVSRFDAVSIEPNQVTVTAPDGSDLRVRQSDPGETIDRNSDHFVAAVEFHAPEDGTYRLRFRTATTRVMIQTPFGDVFRNNVGWIVAVVMGGLLFVGGLVLLIVGIARRSSARRAARFPTPQAGSVPPAPPTPAVAPAGWFPDPHGQHRLRYWDGTIWTDHIAD